MKKKMFEKNLVHVFKDILDSSKKKQEKIEIKNVRPEISI